jgi:phosphatidylglycerophosphate synthase
MEGRKLPTHLECPVDNAIYEVVDILNPIAKELGATPNILTTISGMFGIFAAISIWRGSFAWAALWFLMCYLFDCMDGNFARRYDMVTEFGDYYDHVKDAFVLTLLVITFLFQRSAKIPWFMRIIIIGAMALAFMASLVVIGCQELYYDKHHESASLKMFHCLCGEDAESHLQDMKWFGCGTASLIVAILLVVCSIVWRR